MIKGEQAKFYEDVKHFAYEAKRLLGKGDKKFDTLIIITPKDCKRLVKLYPRLVDSFDNGDIGFVSAPEIRDVLEEADLPTDRIFTIDENAIIPFADVHSCMTKHMEPILAGRELPRGVTGWYYQQFLKMQYSFLCEDEYYMVWDGDTIPCKKINMFHEESGKPYLDMKHEYHAEYFETMGKLFPGFHKVIERSFISEHMLIKTDIMQALIADIEKNDSIPGEKFWEKIINVIPPEKIQDSSFSEFETYGTYCALKRADVYKLREWHSFRQGGTFFSIDTICDRDFTWLSKDFDAISFEKGHKVREDNANLFDNPYYQEKLTPKQMLQAAQMEYREGYKEVWADDDIASANASKGGFRLSDDVTPESRLKYLDNNTYRIYAELGDKLFEENIDQAYLCYENARFLCDDPAEKDALSGKLQKALDTGKVSVNKTAFVILSYNNTYFLQRCIESIYTNCDPESFLLVIFENGSTDGTAKWLSEWGEAHEEALIILNDENLGFSGGNNAACQYIPEGYDIFYLNNDTRVPANALFWLRMGLYSAKDVGGVGAVQNYAITDQLEEVNFGAPEQYVEYGAKTNVPMEGPYEEQTKLCGFAMLIKSEVFDKTGGFDEAFSPGYLEDDDLSMQIRSLGYRLLVCHNAFIYHAGGQSFRKNNDVNSLFTEHRKILVSKWGFDTTIQGAMSKNEMTFAKALKDRGYSRDSHFTVLHIDCGCGNMLGYIHYLYPKAELYGVEKDENARKYALPFINIFGSEEELTGETGSFDVVARNLG
jgi:GT2 family glycosyltransferase